MSACSNTLRALSQSRIPTNKTLLPFLYQTATIQQWKPTARPIARRSISRYSRKDDTPTEDIPFENKEDLPPALDELEPARKTTITGSERAAFEKLYKKFNTRGSRQNEKDHEVEIDAIADEYWEPDEDEDPNKDLDKIFDDALKGGAKPREWNRSGQEQLRNSKPKQNLQTLAEHVLKGTRPAEMKQTLSRTKRKKELGARAQKLNEERMQERNRVEALLKSAKTDRELWDILHREVFSQVRALDLDSTSPPAPGSRTNPPATVNPKILFTNYPHYLLVALTTLRTHFPSSPLPMSILPTIKSLGRSSYALGATTALYTQLLRTAWLQQSSYPLLNSLLTDMHNGAIEFSLDTLHLLDQVIKEFDMARSGRLGREMQMVYGMQQFGEGIREVRRWRQIVASRMGVEDGRREKGTVPVPRRRRVVDDIADAEEHVPLVEGINSVSEESQAPQQEQEQAQAQAQPLLHDVPLDADFGFLSNEDSVETSATNDQPASGPKEDPKGVEEKLQEEARDDIKEEQNKTADKSEATAKTSSGEPIPWTPS